MASGTAARIAYSEAPKLLGLVIDEKLGFRPQAERALRALRIRGKVADALSGTNWGCDRTTLRTVHLTYVQAGADYGLSVYGAFAKRQTLRDLDVQSNGAACRLSGCPQGTRTVVAYRVFEIKIVLFI